MSILQPQESAVYHVFDTISVSFTAMDETQLSSVSVRLVNSDLVAVSPAKQVTLSSGNANGYAELAVDDKLMETGDYHVLVIASDGVNETREYRKVRIIALPKERRAVFFSNWTGTGADAIWKVDSLFQGSMPWIQAGQDILKLQVNSLKDRLTLVGNYSIGIRQFDISTGAVLWTDETFSLAQVPRFTDIFGYENTLFVSLYDRELRSYGIDGALTLNAQTGNYRPEEIHADENYLVVEMNLVGNDDHFLFVHHAATKALLWQLDVPLDVTAICPLQGDEVLLFGNNGDQARVLHYDIGNNGYWEPRLLPAGRVLDAVKMDGPVFAIAHDNGIYSYTYSPNYLNLIHAGSVYQDICFDVDKGVIIGASQNMLQELSISGQVLNTVVHSDSISSIDIHYTR